MKLRTQLVLAFFLLAILPLSGIVLYGQLSSEQAFRHAVEEEALLLAGEIERNLGDARRDLQRRWSRVKNASSWDAEWNDNAAFGKALESAFLGMGEVVDLVTKIEVVPTVPEVSAAPEPVPAPDPASAPVPPGEPAPESPTRATKIEISGRTVETPSAPEWKGNEPFAVDFKADVAKASERLAQRLVALRQRLSEQREIAEKARHGDGGAVDFHEALDATVAAEALEVELQKLEVRDQQLEKVLGDGFSAVIAGGLGRLDADIDVHQFFRRVLARTQRENGEVPFALGPSRELYVISDEDRDHLQQVAGGDIGELATIIEESGEICEREGWIMATREDPETEMVFGIARPIRDSLAEMQRASGRNLLLGLGMISLALVGVLPLSGRLSRGLRRLTAEADRLASGDLAARAHVGGRDELGQLAGAFNRMAAQLEENQTRLLEQERREREQEMQRLLLESENARRGEELEAARDFQLSMLPSRLPEHPTFEVAVLMKTATEVGGDYYDFLAPVGATTACPLTVAIGDATGHGARAGTMVTVIKTLFASRARECPPEGFLTEANCSIRCMALDRMTMALLIARFEQGRVEVASAGMPPPLVFRGGEQGAVEEVELSGLPLGAMDDTAYVSGSFELAPGECVLLMSDGFAELPDAEGEPIGYGAVRDLFARIGHRSADDVMLELTSALEGITEGNAPTDDVTFVVVRRAA